MLLASFSGNTAGLTVAFSRCLLSNFEDLNLFSEFNIVFTMAKERISLAFFPNMCSGAALLAVQTVQALPPENGQSGQSAQDDIHLINCHRWVMHLCQDE